MAAIETEVGRVTRACAPSCKKNKPNEACACTNDTKLVVKVEIFAVFDGIRRYRAYFAPNPKNKAWPRISNKERFDEKGDCSEVGVNIPDNIYQAMAKRAIAVIMSGAT